MRSKPKRSFATRLPPEHADLIEAAVEKSNVDTSEFLRQVVKYYIRRNPEDNPAFYPEGSVSKMLDELEK